MLLQIPENSLTFVIPLQVTRERSYLNTALLNVTFFMNGYSLNYREHPDCLNTAMFKLNCTQYKIPDNSLTHNFVIPLQVTRKCSYSNTALLTR